MKTKNWLSHRARRYIAYLVNDRESGVLSRDDEERFWEMIDENIGLDNIDPDGKLVVPGVEFFVDNGRTHFQQLPPEMAVLERNNVVLPKWQVARKSLISPRRKRKSGKPLGLCPR